MLLISLLNNYWIQIYAFALVLLPPISVGSKNLFCAELLLLPLCFSFVIQVAKDRKLSAPRPLIYVLLSIVVAFIAGMFRGTITDALDMYKDLTPHITYYFTLSGDLIKAIRFGIMFSTPLLVFYFYRNKNPQNLPDTFLSALTMAGILSVGVALLEQFGFIDLGHPREHEWWGNRSYGTFPGPHEASLFYGMFAFRSLLELIKGKAQYRYHLFCLVLFFVGLALTRTISGGIAFSLALFFYGIQKLSMKWRLVILPGFITVAVLAFQFSPFLNNKLYSFLYRVRIWPPWWDYIQEHPWFLFTGLGWSGIVTDNSFGFCLIKGGIFFCVAIFLWVKFLYGFIAPRSHKFLFLFWVASWFPLDSITFWGVGRIMWVLLGLYWVIASCNETPSPGKKCAAHHP